MENKIFVLHYMFSAIKTWQKQASRNIKQNVFFLETCLLDQCATILIYQGILFVQNNKPAGVEGDEKL